MDLSTEELILIEESLRQAKQIYKTLEHQEKCKLDDTKNEIIGIFSKGKLTKKENARINTLTDKLKRHKANLDENKNQSSKYDVLISKIQNVLSEP